MFRHVDRANYICPTNLFIALLRNDEFKKKFANVYEEYANNIMSLDKVNPLIEEFSGDVTELLSYSQSRWWGYFGGSRLENILYAKNNYHNNILPQMKKFFEERPKYTLEHMRQYLSSK